MEASTNNSTDNKRNKEKRPNTNTSHRGRNKGGMIETEPISGCRDFEPEKMRLQRWLFDHWREVAKLYGFQEYEAPIVEDAKLYSRKGGEEIFQQMYYRKNYLLIIIACM